MVGNKNRRWTSTLSLLSLFLIFSFARGEETGSRAFSGLDWKGFEEGTPSEGRLLWQDNPFIESVDDFSVTDLILTGIIYSEKNRAALINDRFVRKGEKIGSHEVIEVGKNHVVLRNENGLFRLSFSGEHR